MDCFQIHFRMVHSKFQRLCEVISQTNLSVDEKELAAIKYEMAVISSHNIKDIERRLDALGASLSRRP